MEGEKLMSHLDRNPFAGKVKYVDCQIPEGALRKWADQCLTCTHREEGKRRYRFTFSGSTCTDGGTPYNAALELVLEEKEPGIVVTEALIFFSAEDVEAARQMCEYQKRGEEFFVELQQSPTFCGRTLEEILAEPVPINPAGCFCTEPMINHKWRLALATVHHALSLEAAR